MENKSAIYKLVELIQKHDPSFSTFYSAEIEEARQLEITNMQYQFSLGYSDRVNDEKNK
jgi:hypothetical protein